MTLLRNALPVIATVLIVVLGKSVAAFLIVIAFRHPVATALTISASLAQIGEFSFILATLGVHLQLLPEQGRDLILAVAILSILMNPLVFAGVDWIEARLARRTEGAVPSTAPSLDSVDRAQDKRGAQANDDRGEERRVVGHQLRSEAAVTPLTKAHLSVRGMAFEHKGPEHITAADDPDQAGWPISAFDDGKTP